MTEIRLANLPTRLREDPELIGSVGGLRGLHSGIPVGLAIALYQQRSRADLTHDESPSEDFRLFSHIGRRPSARSNPQLYLDLAQARPASARIPPPRPRRSPLPAAGIKIDVSNYMNWGVVTRATGTL